MSSFLCLHHLKTSQDPNWQVKTLTRLFLNIMTNFIPNEIKKIDPHDPSWTTKLLKLCLIGRIDFLKTTKDMGINQGIRTFPPGHSPRSFPPGTFLPRTFPSRDISPRDIPPPRDISRRDISPRDISPRDISPLEHFPLFSSCRYRLNIYKKKVCFNTGYMSFKT